MPSEKTVEEAAARLRAAGLPEALADTLGARVAGSLEQLRQEAEALPLAAEPATTFSAGPPPVTVHPPNGQEAQQKP